MPEVGGGGRVPSQLWSSLCPTQSYYPAAEQTNLCPILLMMSVRLGFSVGTTVGIYLLIYISEIKGTLTRARQLYRMILLLWNVWFIYIQTGYSHQPTAISRQTVPVV